MAEKPLDVNTGKESSPSSAANGQSQSDATGASSTQQSKSTDGVKTEVSLADHVAQTLEQSGSKPLADGKEVEVKEELSSESELDENGKKKVDDKKEEVVDEKKEEDGDKTEDGEEGKEEQQTDKGPVPYTRFQEVVAKRTELETKVKEYEPKIKNYENIIGFCEQNNIAPQDFNAAIETQALISSGRGDEALKRLLPIVESLQGYVGDKLPAELQAKVDAGTLEMDDAKELAQARAKAKFGEANQKRNQQSMEQRQQEEYRGQLVQASNTWEQAKQTADPDYKPKANDSLPDGKWEIVKDKYLSMLHATDTRGNYLNPVNSPQAMTALMDKAYAAVSATYTNLTSNRQATRKRLPSNGSSGNAGNKSIEGAKTLQEAIGLALSGRR